MTFSPGTYAIISGSDFLALDLSKRDGTTVIGYPLHGKPNQRVCLLIYYLRVIFESCIQWIVASRNGGFTIKNEQYGKFLNVDARGIHLHDADLIGVDDEFIWTVTPDKKTPNLFRFVSSPL